MTKEFDNSGDLDQNHGFSGGIEVVGKVFLRKIPINQSGIRDFLGSLIRHNDKGEPFFDENHPAIAETVEHAKENGTDAVLDLGESVVAKAGHFLASHPKYVDAAKVAGVLAGALGVGTVIGIALYRQKRHDDPRKK